eukprot:m.16179 g.16179  ORF g.16179 m.16179 type:complete len:313 (-) comp10913_c0_seq1:128-1066(-)
MIAKLRKNHSGGSSGRSPSSRPVSKFMIGSPSNFTHTGHVPSATMIQADLAAVAKTIVASSPQRPTPAPRRPSIPAKPTASLRLRDSSTGPSVQTPESRQRLRDSISGPMQVSSRPTMDSPSRLRSLISDPPPLGTHTVLVQGYLLIARTIGNAREWEQHWCQLKQGWRNILAFTSPACDQLTASVPLTDFIHSRMTRCGDDRAEQHVIVQTAQGTRVILCNCPIKAASWVQAITKIGLQLQSAPRTRPPSRRPPAVPVVNTYDTEQPLYANLDTDDEDDDGFEAMCKAQGLLGGTTARPPSLPVNSPPPLF